MTYSHITELFHLVSISCCFGGIDGVCWGGEDVG